MGRGRAHLPRGPRARGRRARGVSRRGLRRRRCARAGGAVAPRLRAGRRRVPRPARPRRRGAGTAAGASTAARGERHRRIPDPLASRRGRNGRGLSRKGSDARPRGRHQSAPTLGRRRAGGPRALRGGGSTRLRPQSPEHRHDLRRRGEGGSRVHRDGARPRAHAARAALREPAPCPRRTRPGRPACRRPLRRARARDHPPGPQAREPHGDAGRTPQGPGLRNRKAPGPDGCRRSTAAGRPHRRREDPGNGRLHVARAGCGQARGAGVRPVLLRHDPLRDGHRASGVEAKHGGGDADGHHPRGSPADCRRGPGHAHGPALDHRSLPRQGSRGTLCLDPGSRPRPGDAPKSSRRGERRRCPGQGHRPARSARPRQARPSRCDCVRCAHRRGHAPCATASETCAA